MATKRDYYDVLGVSKRATPDEIRKAHRKLVRQYHPDANPNNPQAAEKFKEVQEAYDVLSDEEKRKQYDEYGHAAPPPGGAPGADPYEAFRRASGNRNYRSWKGGPNVTVEDFDFGQGGGGFSDIFEQFFGGKAKGRRGQAPVQEERGQDIEHAVTISFDQAARGTTIPIQLNRDGKIESLDLKIPAGVKEGSRVRLRGKGQPGYNGQNGDLYIICHVTEHPYFRRDDLDIYLDLPVSMYEAILGTKVEVPTLDGKVTLTVPPGTSSGAKLRIRGRGIRRSDDQGDQFVVVKVIVPKITDDAGKHAIQELAAKHPVNARGDVRW